MRKIYLKLISISLLFCSFYCTDKAQQLKKRDNLTINNIIPNFHQLKWNTSYYHPLEDCEFKLIKLDNDNAIMEARCMNEDNFEPYFVLELVQIKAKNRNTFDILSSNDLLNLQDVHYDDVSNIITYNLKKSSVAVTNLKPHLLSEINYLENALGTWEDMEENSSNILLSFSKDSESNIRGTIHSENEVFEKKVVYYSTDSGIISFDNSSVMYLEMGYNEQDVVDEIVIREIVEGVILSYSLSKLE